MKKLSQQDLKSLTKKLVTKNLACIVIKSDGTEIEIAGTGIAPAIHLLETGTFDTAIVVDKIIGKAAAMLMAKGHVRYAHGVVMSQSAADWLTRRDISFSYDTIVQHIINRNGTGICPMEETVRDITDEESALKALKRTLADLKTSQK